MFITALGTAAPPRRYTKLECWEALQVSEVFQQLSRRTQAIAQTVLLHDNGIEARHLALDTLDDAFRIDPETLYARFSTQAPRLAGDAAAAALRQAQLPSSEIDAVIVSTCTGYLCPGLTGYVAEALALRPDVQAFDLVGQGCAAALPNLRLGQTLIVSGQCRHVLSVCVEVCSAAMYLDDDPGVMISACLFGDGAGAAILSREPLGHTRRIAWRDAQSFIDPKKRELLRFEERDGMLRNVLTREVPALAAQYAAQVLAEVCDRARLTPGDISTWILHAGGRDVLHAIADRIGVARERFSYSAGMLREYGNLSSAFVYFVLAAALEDEAPGGAWWLASFGAGFSSHGALLEVE